MEKKIINESREVISEEQALLLDNYEIVHENNGIVKKIERINANSPFPRLVIYYIANDEDYSEIVSSLSGQYNSFEIIETETYLNFEIQTSRSYIDDLYAGKVKILNKNAMQICWQEFDLNEEPKHTETEKYYFDSAGNKLLTFYYDNSGLISSIDGERAFDPFDGGVRSVNEQEFTHYNPRFLAEHPYYKNATFLP